MIAPTESESEHEHADGAESIAAQGENGGAISAEGAQPRRNSRSRRACAAISVRACRIPRVVAAVIVVAGAMTEDVARSTVTAADTAMGARSSLDVRS